MYSLKLWHVTVLSAFIISACNQEEKELPAASKPVEVKLAEPFRFHKAVEVKPGLTLDVVSWGRGSESVGAYLILRSDSTHLKYKSISGELDGEIVDVWNMDMDADGDPELYIQAKGEGEGSHLSMYVYEFNNSGSARQITFPNLSGKSKKGYKGGDSVYIKDDVLMREFPVTNDEDKNNPTTEKKILKYQLRNNSFSVDEVKQETDTAAKKK
ncbi:hypothetical protein [Daejeonella oryzae]|uniref:hypothetical protein n=1 Tax=Daejeonella oryzae TaxID=1122943 RepID=UPI0004049F85|nr:hypothetical protein [Daejeonella oryzae]